MFCIRRKDILLFKIVHLTYYAIKRGKKKEKEKESFQIDPLPKQLHSSTTQQFLWARTPGTMKSGVPYRGQILLSKRGIRSCAAYRD